MKQTKLESLVEVCLNTAIGFAISYSAGPLMYMYLDVPYSHTGNLVITSGFTVLSIARGYIIRRWFNAGLSKTARKITVALYNWRNSNA